MIVSEYKYEGQRVYFILFYFYFIMKSYTRYTIKIKGKSKILSIQRPDNINF